MRTVKVDQDHFARFERVAKGVYRFAVCHAATDRLITEGACRVKPGDSADGTVATSAAEQLRLTALKRERDSRAFANGKHVPGASSRVALPPRERAAVEAGELDIAGAVPQKMIRDAYKVSPIAGESMASFESRRNAAALAIGHQILIGVTDEVILMVARGAASIKGSMRTGATVEIAA